MKTSLRDRILRYLSYRPDQWINGGEVERLASENGYKPSNASRRLRECQEDGLIEVKYNLDKKHTAWYRIVNETKPTAEEREATNLQTSTLNMVTLQTNNQTTLW